MKHLMVSLLVAFMCLAATAQDKPEDRGEGSGSEYSLGTSDLTAGQTGFGTFPNAPVTITQNANTGTLVALTAVHCGSGGIHADNSYLRRFDLDGEFGITGAVNASNFTFGVESSAGGPQPVTVNLYEIPNDAAFIFGNMTLVGTAGATIADGNLTFTTVDVTGTVNGATHDLVTEVFTPDGAGVRSLFLGANDLGQTAEAFLAASTCGIDEPATTTSIGFPNAHFLMVLTGDTVVGGEVPTLSEWGFIAFITLLMVSGVFMMNRRKNAMA